MHEYSYNSDERRRWTVWLFRSSIVLTGAINLAIAMTHEQNNLILVAQPPTVMSVFALANRLFLRRLWRWRCAQWLGVVSVPDLNGNWTGHYISSYHNEAGIELEEAEKKPVKVTISQTWERISIDWEADNSSSKSYVASIIRHSDTSYVLHYEYANRRKSLVSPTQVSHDGTVGLKISKDLLEGDYFTNANPPTHGRIRLERKP